jgi:hypothetical protein
VASIGSLAVLITGNADGLDKELAKARDDLASFASAASSTMKGLQTFFDLSPIKSLLTAIPGIGDAFAGLPTTPPAFFQWVKDGIADTAEMAKQARRLGVDINTMAALRLLSGGSGEGLERGLFHLSKELGAAASGGKEAQMKFAALGLSWQELSQVPLDQAVAKVADRFNELGSSQDKAYLSGQLFGKGALGWGDILAKGGGAIDAAKARLAGMGGTLTDFDVASIIRAQRAMDSFAQSLKVIQRNAAIAFAPLFGEIADQFTKLVSEGGGLKQMFRDWADVLAEALATTLDFGRDLVLTFDHLGKSIEDTSERLRIVANIGPEVLKAVSPGFRVGLEGAAAGQQLRQAGGAGAIAESKNPFVHMLDQASARLRGAQRDPWYELIKSGVSSLFPKQNNDDLLAASRQTAEMQAKADELTVSLQAEATAFGLSSNEVKIQKLALEGATEAQLAQARAYDSQLTALQNLTAGEGVGLNIYEESASKIQGLVDAANAGTITFDQMANASKKLREELAKKEQSGIAAAVKESASPLEKFAAKVQELQGLAAAGLDPKAFDTGLYKAFEDLEKANGPAAGRLAGVLEQGSSGALSAINQTNAALAGTATDPQQRVIDAVNRASEIQRRQATDVAAIADVIKNARGRDIQP